MESLTRPPLETAKRDPEEVALAMRTEAARLLVTMQPVGEKDFSEALRLVDCIVSVAMLRTALVQAEAVRHISTSDNP